MNIYDEILAFAGCSKAHASHPTFLPNTLGYFHRGINIVLLHGVKEIIQP